MPWKQNYTISNEKTVPDADLRWPDGMRCCFSVTVDLTVAVGPEGIRPRDIQTPEAFFALNDGLEQILRVLRLLPKHELKLAASTTSYSHPVRDAAKRLLRELG